MALKKIYVIVNNNLLKFLSQILYLKLTDSFNNVEEIIIQSEEALLIRKAVAKIAERDRTIILLRFSGYSYREIAQIIKIEQSSVGTLLARAKKRFKEALTSLKGSDFCASK